LKAGYARVEIGGGFVIDRRGASAIARYIVA
jgi:hypothetical protein